MHVCIVVYCECIVSVYVYMYANKSHVYARQLLVVVIFHFENAVDFSPAPFLYGICSI